MGNGNYCKFSTYDEHGELKTMKPTTRYLDSGVGVGNSTGFTLNPSDKVKIYLIKSNVIMHYDTPGFEPYESTTSNIFVDRKTILTKHKLGNNTATKRTSEESSKIYKSYSFGTNDVIVEEDLRIEEETKQVENYEVDDEVDRDIRPEVSNGFKPKPEDSDVDSKDYNSVTKKKGILIRSSSGMENDVYMSGIGLPRATNRSHLSTLNQDFQSNQLNKSRDESKNKSKDEIINKSRDDAIIKSPRDDYAAKPKDDFLNKPNDNSIYMLNKSKDDYSLKRNDDSINTLSINKPKDDSLNKSKDRSRDDSKNQRIKDEIKELFVPGETGSKDDQRYTYKINLEKRDNSQFENSKSESPIVESLEDNRKPINIQKFMDDKEVQTDDLYQYLYIPHQEEIEDSESPKSKDKKARQSRLNNKYNDIAENIESEEFEKQRSLKPVVLGIQNKPEFLEKSEKPERILGGIVGADEKHELHNEEKKPDEGCGTILSELNFCYDSSKPQIDTYNIDDEQFKSNNSNQVDEKYKLINKYIESRKENEQADETENRYKRLTNPSDNLNKGEHEPNQSYEAKYKIYANPPDTQINTEIIPNDGRYKNTNQPDTHIGESYQPSDYRYSGYGGVSESRKNEELESRFKNYTNLSDKTERIGGTTDYEFEDGIDSGKNSKSGVRKQFGQEKYARGYNTNKPIYENKLELNYSHDNVLDHPVRDNIGGSDGFNKDIYKNRKSAFRKHNLDTPDRLKYTASTQQSFFNYKTQANDKTIMNGYKPITPIARGNDISTKSTELRGRQNGHRDRDRDHSNISIRDTSKGMEAFDKWTRIVNKYKDRFLTWKDLGLDVLQLLHESIFHKSTDPCKDLYINNLGKILFHGELFKLSKSINVEVSKYAFGTKFCVLTRDALNYYTSKENFLRQLRPLYSVRYEDIKEVNKISSQFINEETNLQIKPPRTANGELYCFYIRTERVVENEPYEGDYRTSASQGKSRSTYKSIRAPYKNVRPGCEKSDRSMLLDSKCCFNV
jgi:hypothetical protein